MLSEPVLDCPKQELWLCNLGENDKYYLSIAELEACISFFWLEQCVGALSVVILILVTVKLIIHH